ncbi:MAG TPA: chorismate mutase, partial [bacterium]|nr:chorismate mutase [bacterium]
ELRRRIDHADHELVEALAARMRTVTEIGAHKKAHGVTILQPERWREIFESRAQWAASLGLRPEFVQQLYELIHLESIRTQTEAPE